jgi:serine/threonine protein kinase
MTQEVDDKVVAQKLLQSQLISRSDLNKALAVQTQLKSQGHDFSLAKVLIQSRMATAQSIHQALASGVNPHAATVPDLSRISPGENKSSSNQALINTRQQLSKSSLAASDQDLKNTIPLEDLRKSPTQISPPLPRFGPYQVTEKIGRGGMGLVYKARHDVLERIVALKTLALEASHSDPVSAMIRFEREAKTMARLQHANIVPIYDIGGEGHQAYIAMEYVSGGSVAERIARDGKMTSEDTVVYALKIGRALEHAHKASIIHRDLKPANILINPEGEPMVADFGLALISNQGGKRLSRTGTVVGTLHYMSPEQLNADNGEVDQRSDIYSLGITLFEMLTGYAPFNGRTNEQLMYEILFGKEVKLPEHCKDVPEALRAIIFKCIERNPQHRYPTASALCQDLAALMNGKEVKARARSLTPKPVLAKVGPEPKAKTSAQRPQAPALQAAKIGLLSLLGLAVVFLCLCLPLLSLSNSNKKAKEAAHKATLDLEARLKDLKDKKAAEKRAQMQEDADKQRKERSSRETTHRKPEKEPEKKFVAAPKTRLENFLSLVQLRKELKAICDRRKSEKPDGQSEQKKYRELLKNTDEHRSNNHSDYEGLLFKLDLHISFYNYHHAFEVIKVLVPAADSKELNGLQSLYFSGLVVRWIHGVLELESRSLELEYFNVGDAGELDKLNQKASQDLFDIALNVFKRQKILQVAINNRVLFGNLTALQSKDSGLFLKAKKLARKELKRRPNRSLYQIHAVSLCWNDQEDLRGVLRALNNAIELDGFHAPALAMRGHILSLGNTLKDQIKGKKDLDMAIEMAPCLAQAYRFRFYLLVKSRNRRKAKRDLQSYLKIVDSKEDVWGRVMESVYDKVWRH